MECLFGKLALTHDKSKKKKKINKITLPRTTFYFLNQQVWSFGLVYSEIRLMPSEVNFWRGFWLFAHGTYMTLVLRRKLMAQFLE